MPKGKLVVCGNFEWWSEKNDLNKINHKDKNNKGIGFEDILDVFNEAYFYEIYDSAHSDNEQDRYIGFGFAKNLGLSVVQVVYTVTQRIHIISTRLATEQERNFYYDRLREINR